MKLPKVRIKVPGDVIDRPLQIEDAEIIEALVRDCAKVCNEAYKFTHPDDCAKAILARYGLTQGSGE